MNTYTDIPARKNDIQSFQLIVKESDLNNGFPTEFNMDLQGEVEICVKTIQVQFSSEPVFMRMQIESPNLQFDYGNERYINVVYPFSTHNLPSGQTDYYFRTYMNGKILINILDTSTKAEPANFSLMILSGTIRKL